MLHHPPPLPAGLPEGLFTTFLVFGFFFVTWFHDRQGNPEQRTGPQLAFHRHRSVVTLHQAFGDRQPESVTTLLTAPGLINPVEAVKDPVKILLRNSFPKVLHPNLNGPQVPGERQVDFLALVGVLNGVITEDDQNLLEVIPVNRHQDVLI